MWSYPEILLHLPLTGLLVLAGVQDWRTREVSNWITIPLFLLGIVGAGIALWQEKNPLPAAACLLLVLVFRLGWAGGADVKVLIGLWGLWPLAAVAGMLLMGAWGLTLVWRFWRRMEKARIPGIVPIAAGTFLTILLELSIMLVN